MSCPDRRIFVIIGEVNTVMTAMRSPNHWSSFVNQSEERDSLLKGFSSLKDTINHLHSFKDLDPITYLSPFLDLIRSENTSAVVTGLGLSALYKFLAYGFLDMKNTSAGMAAENIADAVTHARFMMVDASSDEIALMKIIQVLRLLLLSPTGTLLTNSSVCEVIQSFLRICFETRFSEILRKSAESAIADTVQLLFSCLPQFTDDSKCTSIRKLKRSSFDLNKNCDEPNASNEKISHSPGDSSTNSSAHLPPSSLDDSKSEAALNVFDVSSDCKEICTESSKSSELASSPEIGPLLNKDSSVECDGNALPEEESANGERLALPCSIDSEKEKNSAIHSDLEDSASPHNSKHGKHQNTYSSDTFHETNDFVNPWGIRFTTQKSVSGNNSLVPYGFICVRELLHLLISLINPLDRHNTDETIRIGLNLITIALETGADSLGKFNSLLLLIKDEMCHYLFSLLSVDHLSLFSSVLRIFFLLFEALRTHLKFQLEMFLTRLMDIVTSESSKCSYEKREISLDCLTQLFHIPGFVTELYINYDCDLHCSNLFQKLTKWLSKNTFPLSGLYSIHLLSLDALLTIIDSIANCCHYSVLNKPGDSQGTCTDQFSSGSLAVQTPVSGCELTKKVLYSYDVTENSSFGVKMQQHPFKQRRRKVTLTTPSYEEVRATRHKKKILASGIEQFNSDPSKGIVFLQEKGLLESPLDPKEVATFLRDNPELDKKVIGEYISKRKNLEVLEAFVKSFTFEGIRIDEALRQFLETFRLPGEAPLISLIMEQFAERWHTSNKSPFANNDAAFTLAYAVIMLNVDQHNHNVKKQKNPMTSQGFKKNLKNVNGGDDFDQEMLEKIYQSIRNEEIVMPEEQTGLVRENYLWKVLLRRGSSKKGKFLHVPNGLFDRDLFSLVWGPASSALSFIFDKTADVNVMEKTIVGFQKCALIAAHYGMTDVFDNLIISLCKFTMLVSSNNNAKLLPVAFGNSSKAQIATRAVFRLAYCHGDTLRDGWKNLLDCISNLYRARLLPKKLVEAEDFLSPNGVISLICEDLPSMPQVESGIFSSLYSYIASNSPSQQSPSQEDETAKKTSMDCIRDCHLEQLFIESKFLRIDSLQELIKTLISMCPSPEPSDSEQSTFDENTTVFFLELLVKIILSNRDRVMNIWPGIQDHMFSIIMSAAVTNNNHLLERAVTGILRIARRLVFEESMIQQVLESLKVLFYLKPHSLLLISCQVAYALNEMLKANVANICDEHQWSIIFLLLERVGAGAKPLFRTSVCDTSSNEMCNSQSLRAQSDSEINRISDEDFHCVYDKGYTSDSELCDRTPSSSAVTKKTRSEKMETEAKVDDFVCFAVPFNEPCLHKDLSSHNSLAFLKCCETLAFLIQDKDYITTKNFKSCVYCLRTFVEASTKREFSEQSMNFNLSKRKKSSKQRQLKKSESKNKSLQSQSNKNEFDCIEDEERENELLLAYLQASLQMLELMYALLMRASKIFIQDNCDTSECNSDINGVILWSDCWCPLLQGIARLCCDNRLAVRTSALSYLQRSLLICDLQVLTPIEWEACFNEVLFPLLAKLLENISPEDQYGMEETRTRAANLLCKVFLQHLTPLLTLSTFMALWLTILDFMDSYIRADITGSLAEAIPESLKNMLLVMNTANVHVFQSAGNGNENEENTMWHITWDRINSFLPNLKDELLGPSSLSMPPVSGCNTNEINPVVEGSNSAEEASVGGGDCCKPEGKELPCNKSECSIMIESSNVKLQENTLLESSNLSVVLHPPAISLVPSS